MWLVDPDARSLEVYQLAPEARWLLLATLQEADAVAQPPFEAVSFALARLWA